MNYWAPCLQLLPLGLAGLAHQHNFTQTLPPELQNIRLAHGFKLRALPLEGSRVFLQQLAGGLNINKLKVEGCSMNFNDTN